MSLTGENHPPDQQPPTTPESTPEINDFLATIQRDPQTWLKTVRDQETELHRLRNLKAQAEASIPSSSSQPPVAPVQPKKSYVFPDKDLFTPVRKSPKHPDPNQYDGNTKGLRGFIFNLKAKFRANADWYRTEQDLVDYAMGRLTGNAADQMLPLVEMENSPIHTITLFYAALEQAFGDPNREATAQKEIQKLRQANRLFNTYLSDFQALIPYTGYDERNARFQFKQGLCAELKASLVPVDEDSLTFDDLKKVCQRMDNKNRELPSFLKNPNKPANASAPRAPAAPSVVNRSTNDGNTAMDLSIVNQVPARSGTPRGPLTPSERQRRVDNDLCLYAGCTGHQAKDCPFKKAAEERRTMIRSATVEPAPAAQTSGSGNA